MSVKARKRPVYSPEFKAEAVSKSLNIGINKASKELGIPPSTLRTWMLANENPPAVGKKPSYEELEQEVQKLRREMSYVNEINRILKKSTAIFSAAEIGGSK